MSVMILCVADFVYYYILYYISYNLLIEYRAAIDLIDRLSILHEIHQLSECHAVKKPLHLQVFPCSVYMLWCSKIIFIFLDLILA